MIVPSLFSLQNLEVTLHTRAGALKALDGVSFDIASGETVALVGESGCGKSLTAMAIMRLLQMPPARIIGGKALLDGVDLAALPEREMRSMRGKQVSMIFQDPMSSLNPVLDIGTQLVEVLRAHSDLTAAAAWRRAQELLELVRIPNAAARLHEYPHRLSGGMCQRVMIAMAIACRPRLLIADEPTTALDVTIQAQLLSLLKTLQAESDMGLLIITHDLGVVAEIADRVVVMYAGSKVEEAPVETLFAKPLHPYTQGLLGATPGGNARRGDRLTEISGMVPALSELPAGCAFVGRCSQATARCSIEKPVLFSPAPGRKVACFSVEEATRSHGARHELANCS
jgi:oligopeptide/dipeptide ABC transporter ATP-binding protein